MAGSTPFLSGLPTEKMTIPWREVVVYGPPKLAVTETMNASRGAAHVALR